MAEPWSLDSWKKCPIKQQPKYANEEELQKAVEQVSRLPPLVTHEEVDRLRAGLAEVAEGKRFLLQGGDCAERFLDCAAEPIEKKLRILLQMSLVLTWGARIPTLRIARMAGQFAKPRSKDTEIIDGVEYSAFRGDNVNSFDTSSRSADPDRMIAGYFHSAATLNYARSLLGGGLADLHSASHWDLGFVQDATHRSQYKEMADRILSALDFMRVCGVGNEAALKTADVFMSHEGLQLAYEAALTRPVRLPGGGSVFAGVNTSAIAGSSPSAAKRQTSSSLADAIVTPTTPVAPPAAAAHHHLAHASAAVGTPLGLGSTASSASSSFTPGSALRRGVSAPTPSLAYYNLGTHFLWIGDRTRQLDHAHVEYFRGIANPVGIKVGPTTPPADLVALIRVLWPSPRTQKGKIMLITRMGAGQVRNTLPPLVKAVREAGFESPVVWTCDPMHGNTRVTSTGIKTRDFDDILTELRDTFEVHRDMGSRLGGCHFELTGENVTECTGGPEHLMEGDLPRQYTTYCDPRLNYAQGMELAFLIAQYLADIREEELARETGIPAESFIGSEGDERVFASATGYGSSSSSSSTRAAAPSSTGASNGTGPAGSPRSIEQSPQSPTSARDSATEADGLPRSSSAAEASDTDTDMGSVGSMTKNSLRQQQQKPRRARFAAGRGADRDVTHN